jgi:hypothetical protein
LFSQAFIVSPLPPPEIQFNTDYLGQLRHEIQAHPTRKGKQYGKQKTREQMVGQILYLKEAITKDETPPEDILKAVKGLKTAFKDLKLDEPKNDLEAFEQTLQSETGKTTGKLTLRETDDLVAMLNTGTTPHQTCQRWTEHTSYNTALPGYASDANTKQIQLLDQNGNIIARKIIRILSTSEGPEIIPERTYPENTDYTTLIDTHLRKRAEEIGVAYKPDKKRTIQIPESRNQVIYSDTLFGAQTITTPTQTTK